MGGGGLLDVAHPPTHPQTHPEAEKAAGRLKSLKRVISHINLANPVHHLFFFFGPGDKQGPALRACFPDPPPPPIHTASKGPPPPDLQWTAGPVQPAPYEGSPSGHSCEHHVPHVRG